MHGCLGSLGIPRDDAVYTQVVRGLRVVLGIQSLPDAHDMHESSCRAIRFLLGANVPPEESRSALAVVLTALRESPGSFLIQQHGCGALAVLAAECKIGEDIVREGGVKVLASSLALKSEFSSDWLEGPVAAVDTLVSMRLLNIEDKATLAEGLRARLKEMASSLRAKAEGTLAAL